MSLGAGRGALLTSRIPAKPPAMAVTTDGSEGSGFWVINIDGDVETTYESVPGIGNSVDWHPSGDGRLLCGLESLGVAIFYPYGRSLPVGHGQGGSGSSGSRFGQWSADGTKFLQTQRLCIMTGYATYEIFDPGLGIISYPFSQSWGGNPAGRGGARTWPNHWNMMAVEGNLDRMQTWSEDPSLSTGVRVTFTNVAQDESGFTGLNGMDVSSGQVDDESDQYIAIVGEGNEQLYVRRVGQWSNVGTIGSIAVLSRGTIDPNNWPKTLPVTPYRCRWRPEKNGVHHERLAIGGNGAYYVYREDGPETGWPDLGGGQHWGLAWSQDGDLLAVGKSTSPNLTLLDVETKSVIRQWDSLGLVRDIEFHSNVTGEWSP